MKTIMTKSIKVLKFHQVVDYLQFRVYSHTIIFTMNNNNLKINITIMQ